MNEIEITEIIRFFIKENEGKRQRLERIPSQIIDLNDVAKNLTQIFYYLENITSTLDSAKSMPTSDNELIHKLENAQSISSKERLEAMKTIREHNEKRIIEFQITKERMGLTVDMETSVMIALTLMYRLQMEIGKQH
ncbi:MAG: hypothetical protein QG670_1910 [Thermoproteota archaeon]|nr:hypothetical protein [Thermoproteota archaeon]